jgi:hypothetical protein
MPQYPMNWGPTNGWNPYSYVQQPTYNNYGMMQPGAQQGQAIPQNQTQQNAGRIWVQGEDAAKSYPIAPNTILELWDTERQTIYLKSADASGKPSMQVLDFTIRGMEQQGAAATNYATKEEIAQITEQINTIRKDMKKLKGEEE